MFLNANCSNKKVVSVATLNDVDFGDYYLPSALMLKRITLKEKDRKKIHS